MIWYAWIKGAKQYVHWALKSLGSALPRRYIIHVCVCPKCFFEKKCDCASKAEKQEKCVCTLSSGFVFRFVKNSHPFNATQIAHPYNMSIPPSPSKRPNKKSLSPCLCLYNYICLYNDCIQVVVVISTIYVCLI